MGTKPNWALLAGVRFALALIVCGVHTYIVLPENTLFCSTFYNFGAFCAVLGFLFISGFSIAASMERDRAGFYQRRFERLAPTYFLCFLFALLPFVCIDFSSGHNVATGVNFDMPTPTQFFLTAFAIAPSPHFIVCTFGQSWSLMLEICFYAMAPLFARASIKILVWIVGLSSLFYIAVPHWGMGSHPTEPLWSNVPALGWAWLLGWIVFYHRESEWCKILAVTLPALLVSVSNCNGGVYWCFTLTLPILALIYGERVMIPMSLKKPLFWLGDVSYPLYLVHPAVYILLYNLTPIRSSAFYIVVSIGVSAIVLQVVNAYERIRSKRTPEPLLTPELNPVFVAVPSE